MRVLIENELGLHCPLKPLMITLLHIHTLNIGFLNRENEEWTLTYNLIISEQISALVLTF